MNSSTTLVTGASTGIGLEIAKALASSGHAVYAGVRREKDAKELEAQSPNIKALILDITKPDQLEKAFETIAAECDSSVPFHLVNNAGVAVSAPIETVSLEALREQFEVNVFGAVSATQKFSSLLRAREGRVVMIGSVSGLVSAPFLGVYSASKFALEAVTSSLRMEMAPFGVRVFMVRPGQVATPIWEKNFSREKELLDQMPSEARSRYAPFIESFLKTVKGDVPAAIPASKIADAVVDCLEGSSPRETRIVASAETRLGILAALQIPLWLREQVLKKKYGIN